MLTHTTRRSLVFWQISTLVLLLPFSSHASDSMALTVRDHSNGLRSAYLSRPLRADSLVALEFNVGSFQDSHGIAGLAHLAEHLLLRQPIRDIGGQEVPSLRDFLKVRGGRVQANTGYHKTRFYFQINSGEVPALLHGLQQILRDPVFPTNTVASEIAAVNDEFGFLKTKPKQLLWDALKVATAEQHPFRRFSAGNLDSFALHSLDAIRAALTDFYQRHYQAAKLTAIVVGPQSNPEHQALLADTLGTLPATSVTDSTVPALFSPADMPQQLEVRLPVGQPQVTVLYPLHGIERRHAERAIDWLAYWTEHNSSGSWQQQLVETGLLENVTLAPGLSAGPSATLSLHIVPTQQGLHRLVQLVATVTQALRALLEQADGHALYEHFSTLPALGPAPVIGKKEVLQWFDALSADQQSDHATIQKAALTSFHFDPAFKDTIALNNSLVILLGSNVEGTAHSPVFRVPYRHQRKPYPDVEAIAFSHFTPPVPLAELTTLPALANRAQPPTLLVDTPALDAWHASSSEDSEDLWVRVSLEMPVWSSNVRNRSLKALWLRALQVTSDREDNSRWYHHDSGIGIEIRGGAETLHAHLQSLDEALMQAVTDTQFSELKQALIQEWQQPPSYRFAFEALVDELKQTLIATHDSPQARIAELQSLTPETLRTLQSDALTAVSATLFIYGADQQTAQRLSNTLSFPHRLEQAPTAPQAPPLEPGDPDILSRQLGSDANALLRYQQAPAQSPEDYARLQLLLPMIRHQYFSQLREQQQLAYGVTVVPVNLKDREGFAMIAQSSSTPPDTLQKATEAFLRDFPQWLNTVPTAHLEQLKSKALSELRSRNRNSQVLRGEALANHYWSQITSQRMDDTWFRAVEQSLLSLNREQLSDYFRQLFDEQSQRALIVRGWPEKEEG